MIECPDFLPIGSIVRVKGSSRKLMVVSRAVAVEDDGGERAYYDYGFVLYPEGLIGDSVIYSNHELISEVLHEGFSDEDNEAFVDAIRDVLPNVDVPKGNPEPVGEW